MDLEGSLSITAVLAGWFVLLLVLELAFPLRKLRRDRLSRYAANLVLLASSSVVGIFVVSTTALGAAGWASQNDFGVLPWLSLDSRVELGVGILWMDLSFYYFHLANHKVPLLWRFHVVHHIDPDMDVSTALRFHFGESAFSSFFRALQILPMGISPQTYLVYELAFQFSNFFEHSNLRLPIGVERVVNTIFVTPRMHGVHHSEVAKESNSNYSVVFSWWDRLHRTLRLNVPQGAIVIGIPAFLAKDHNRIWNVLSQPFRKQRDPWLRDDGTRPSRVTAPASDPLHYLLD